MSFSYPRMRLSPHFWLHEATTSNTAARYGIDNTPDVSLLPVLCSTAAGMERVRRVLDDRPIIASSWYRSRALNARIRGEPTSQHMIGEAVDFRAVGLSVVDVARIIVRERDAVRFDQCILERPDSMSPWVHISFPFDREPRGDVLHIVAGGRYESGLGSWA